MNIKHKSIGLLLALCATGSMAAQDAKMDKFISRLMSKMTVEEKIGQLNLASSWGFRSALKENTEEGNLRLVREGNMGAFYGFKDVTEMTRLQKMAVEEGRHGIPFFFGMDVIHGLETTLPTPIALSTSWDTDMIERTTRMAAHEATALGINWVYSPMVDICRDARWGRIAEGCGEDPYLAGEIAKAYVRGYQGQEAHQYSSEEVIACVKHFALYGAAEAGRDYNTVNLSRQEAMNGYMRPYQAAVEAGAGSFMTSFNEFEGIPATCNRYLIDDILRRQWGFKGFVVTDATAIQELTAHGIGDLQEASARALQAGVDMDMNSEGFVKTAMKSLHEGRITTQDIDTACRRILEAKYRLGLFDNPYRYLDPSRAAKQVYTAENRQLTLEAARECQVLLKNNGILPLKKNARIALVGPFADNAEDMQGCWSASSHKKESVTILQGVRSHLQGGSVNTAVGSWLVQDSTLEANLTTDLIGFYLYGIKPQPVHTRPLEEMILEAVNATQEADVIVACLGESNNMNGEGSSRADISIPEPQQRLLRSLKQTGKPVVLVLTTGRPLTLAWEDEQMDAILCSWALGDQAGTAIADVLFGDVNPSGKLTTTFPRCLGQIPIYYNHKNTGRPHGDFEPYMRFKSNYLDVINAPLYPFGYGLSYTTFEYGEPQLSATSLTPDGKITATVSVRNTGQRDGDEIVQLYIHDVFSTSTRPVKELKAFRRIHLKDGEQQHVSFTITPDMLKYYNHELEYVLEPGDFEIMIGPNSRDTKAAVLKVESR